MIKIEKIRENKNQFLELLLLADESEIMIDKYLPDGDLFALYDNDLKSVCVVFPINSDTTDVVVWNWVMYKGYRMESDKIERFIFDANDNIIGYINPDFGKTRYKIEYQTY